MQKQFLALFFTLLSFAATATHNLAGDITYRHISGSTYEVTVTIFADNSITGGRNAIARKDIEIEWGDNTGRDSVIVSSESGIVGEPNTLKRVWIARHTFPGSGSYVIRVEDPNRSAGVNNITNSVNVPFTLETTLRVLPVEQDANNSVLLLNNPLDEACIGEIFVYNPGAFDPDADSIAYEIAESKGIGGQIAPGYVFPSASNSITVDPISGDLTWDTPNQAGVYNVAILIKEFRRGISLGSVLRDIQIRVIPGCNNQPPDIVVQDQYCVEADSTLTIPLVGTDPDPSDNIKLTITGEFFEANFPNSPSLSDFDSFDKPVTASIIWNTICDNVRLRPYTVSIKAEDDANLRGSVSLTNFKNIDIRVVAPAPDSFKAEPIGTKIQLSWINARCKNGDGYFLYRRVDFSGFQPSDCQVGVPAITGYEKIATIDDTATTTYLDDNNGEGLVPGRKYCYLITNFFDDGDESYASIEICSEIPKIIPVITNVSITNTDLVNGELDVIWSEPDSFDQVAFPAPYRYVVYKIFENGDRIAQDSTESLTDVMISFDMLNTETDDHRYQVSLFSLGNGKTLVGNTAEASSIFLNIQPTDEVLNLNWLPEVPWENDSFIVFRKLPSTSNFEAIDTVQTLNYSDSNLINGEEYCYYVASYGKYNLNSVPNPLINLSQENCSRPIDNISPCTPTFNIRGICEEERATISWINSTEGCADDVAYFKIYQSTTLTSDLILLDSTINGDNDSITINGTVSGCYVVSAVDSTGNESNLGSRKCIDFCPGYELPNIFTPNGDGKNDLFVPIPPYRDIDSVEMVIFNRWGEEVFRTTDPDIKWDGVHNISKEVVSAGVYFFNCQVFERSLDGSEPRIINGTVTVLNPTRTSTSE